MFPKKKGRYTMTFYELIDYIKEQTSAYDIFYEKALDFQNTKNKARTGKAKWTEKKIEKVVDTMWEQSMQVLYDKVRSQAGMPKLNPRQAWIDFMDKENVLDSLVEGISETEFE